MFDYKHISAKIRWFTEMPLSGFLSATNNSASISPVHWTAKSSRLDTNQGDVKSGMYLLQYLKNNEK
jgi:hypothetical protein